MIQSTPKSDRNIPLEEEKLSELSPKTRRWIAQEFHDSIAQTLSSMMIFLNFLNAQSSSTKTDLAIRKLNQLSKQLRSNFAYSRNSGVSLSEQIDLMLDELDNNINLIAQLPSHDLRLTPRLQHELCNIIREGLHNINKHAKASVVYLSISGTSQKMRMTLSDNGQGFDYSAIASNSLGLRGIQERARSTSGYAKIESCRGHGTTIEIELKSSPADEIEATELTEMCDYLTQNLRQTLAYELTQLDDCIKSVTLYPNDAERVKTACILVARMQNAVRQIMYALRGTPTSKIALEFIAPEL